MRALPRVLAAAAAVASAAALAGCAPTGGATAERKSSVEIRIAPSAHPVDYEVRLAQADGAYRAVHRMRTGQTRSFAVPRGWVTVRIPGLCVVPTAGSDASTAVVEVDSRACRLV